MMKYEYLKGSEKDFEGAPEWAIKAVSCNASDNSERVIAERQPITDPSWDGLGLPPVGTKCEVQTSSKSPWLECEIVYSCERGVAFIPTNGSSIGCADYSCTDFFRPIRSEAEKKRDAVIEFIAGAIDSHGIDPLNSARFIYDAIAAGKIPGVKLED